MGFISAPAHLPFKVSLIIPNNLMGCSLRALILPLPCSRVSTTPTLGKSKPLWGAGLSAYWVFSTCFPDPLSPLRHSALCPRFRYSLASGWVQPRGSTAGDWMAGGERDGASHPLHCGLTEAASSLHGHDSTSVAPVRSYNSHQIQEAPPLLASHTKDSNGSLLLLILGCFSIP